MRRWLLLLLVAELIGGSFSCVSLKKEDVQDITNQTAKVFGETVTSRIIEESRRIATDMKGSIAMISRESADDAFRGLADALNKRGKDKKDSGDNGMTYFIVAYAVAELRKILRDHGIIGKNGSVGPRSINSLPGVSGGSDA